MWVVFKKKMKYVKNQVEKTVFYVWYPITLLNSNKKIIFPNKNCRKLNSEWNYVSSMNYKMWIKSLIK